MNAFIYIRVSTNDPDNSLDVQLEECQRYAEASGLEIKQTFTDFGSENALLGGLVAMLFEIDQVSAIVVHSRDRLSQNEELYRLVFNYIMARNVIIIAVKD